MKRRKKKGDDVGGAGVERKTNQPTNKQSNKQHRAPKKKKKGNPGALTASESNPFRSVTV